ncbi:hypothetical protein HOB10_00815 [Candidatus Parcubacteria bacterium]|jgi:hypothetical protein|nr:hypothetical protein [Candidatus Parcubacteria bacterium]
MNRKRKNEIKYFYQILSDIKNNIDTLIKELYENQNNLEFYAKSKPVILKSKYPDLKKLNILKKTSKWEITDIGNELLNIYGSKNKDQYQKMIASILGTYSFNGFRPYAVLCKFLFLKYGVDKYWDRDEIKNFLSLPINEIIYYTNNEREPDFNSLVKSNMEEAMRPYSYWLNYLKNAGLAIQDENGEKLNSNVKDFLEIFFAEIENIPRHKKDTERNKYRIIGRGLDQVNFRNELLDVYEGICAITGKYFVFKESNLLEAAHIIPVSHGGSYDVNNGILITSDLHKALDSGAITFDENYNILIDPRVKEHDYLPKIQKINFLPKDTEFYPSLVSINYHKEYIFGRGVIASINN